MLVRELTKQGDGAQEALTTVAIWPGSAEAKGGRVNLALAEAGLRSGNIEDYFDAVLIMEAEGALDVVVGLRSAGFRGVIAVALPEASPYFEQVLGTAGVNVVERTVGAGIAHVVRAQKPNRESSRIPLEIDEGTRRVRLGVVDTVLSEAQYRILAVLGQEPGRWWKARELVAAALGTNHAEDSSLVRVHMNGIRKQLGIARWCLQSERTFGYQLLTSADALMWLGTRRLWSNGHPGGTGGTRSGTYSVWK